MKKFRKVGVPAVVFVLLLGTCFWFAAWMLQLAFDNTCIELEEQYSYLEASEIVTEVENGIRFGKSLEKYYGMDRILERLQDLVPGETEAVIRNEIGEPVYTSFKGKKVEREYTARFFSAEYRKEMGSFIPFGNLRSMVLPIQGKNQTLLGDAVLIYDVETLLPTQESTVIKSVALVFVLALVVTAFYVLAEVPRGARFVPLILVVLGLLVEMAFLYSSYQKQYETLIYENAEMISASVSDKVSDLLEKGFPTEKIEELKPYFEKKTADNDIIGNISIISSDMDIAGKNGRDTIMRAVKADPSLQVQITENEQFISRQMWRKAAAFAALFIICLMISYEVMKVIDILRLRMEEAADEGQRSKKRYEVLSLDIKLVSFVTYTAIYASMPYAAVLMRTWKATVFGLSPEISASLPLSMELTGILLFSVLISKFCQKTDIRILTAGAFLFLLVGNAGSATVESPYMLLFMRGVCSLGFALFKYLMSSVVVAGSETTKDVGRNFGLFNAGLLGGITVGGAVGAIVADAKGYQFNYVFTSILLIAALAAIVCLFPWGYLGKRRVEAAERAEKAGTRLRTVLFDREVMKVLVLGDIPLNMGLMYVVAFLPVYMNFIGLGALSVSYAYLINGLCGVYLGVFLFKVFRFLTPKAGIIFTMLLGAGGILILTVNTGLGVALLSAGIMGLFDGYGTPRVVGFFAAMPQAEKFDAVQMVTVFNVVGSAVQIVCPLLYNLTMQENGETGYLMILGAAYVAVAGLIFFFVKGIER